MKDAQIAPKTHSPLTPVFIEILPGRWCILCMANQLKAQASTCIGGIPRVTIVNNLLGKSKFFNRCTKVGL